jgi:hypothetical protein
MSEDCQEQGGQDRFFIDVEKDVDVEYWARQWSVSKEELKTAVAQVGNNVDAVAQHLGKPLPTKMPWL